MIETVYGHFTTKHYEEAQRRLSEARQGRRDEAAKKEQAGKQE
jgi:hypothetical protein